MFADSILDYKNVHSNPCVDFDRVVDRFMQMRTFSYYDNTDQR